MKHYFTSILFLVCTGFMFAQPVQLNFSRATNNGQVAPGELFTVNITVENFNDVAGMQWALHWDESVLEAVSVDNFNTSLSGFSSSNIAFGDPNAFGSLRLSYAGINNVSLPNDAVLFTLQMRAIGSDCESTVFQVYGSEIFPIEVFDFDFNFKDLCTNTFVSQVSGASCITNSILACNDNINISIGESREVLLHPDIVLEGGPYDYTEISVEPSKVNCTNNGQTLNYTATHNLSGNTCFGTITVEDRLGVCDGSGGATLICSNNIVINLPRFGDVVLFPELFLENPPSDISSISINPSVVTCDEIGILPFTINDDSNGNSCSSSLIVEDSSPPIAVASNNVRVTLDASIPSVSARVFIESINNGSFDNCTSTDDLIFEPTFIDFDCSDLGENEVVMTVIDEQGNMNSVSTIVTVELSNVSGNLNCPDDIIVDCSADIFDPSVIENTSGQASIGTDCVLDFEDLLGFDENNDGDLDDTFIVQGIEISEKYIEACNIGTIQRIWNVGDNADCNQKIYINGGNMALTADDIIWPEDQQIECLDSEIPLPIIADRLCSLSASSFEVTTVFLQGGTCAQLSVEYTVIDWCRFDENTGSGIFTHTAVLDYIDNTAPVIDMITEVLPSCSGTNNNVFARGTDQDCTSNRLTWEVTVDIDNDNVIDFTDSGATLSGDLFGFNIPSTLITEDGPFVLNWQVTDGCGNVSNTTSMLDVSISEVDVTSPTPICISVSSVLVNDNGTEVFAKDFDSGSFDDCTPTNQLRFTFSDVVPSADPSFNSSNNSSVRTFTIADLNGQDIFDVNLNTYVWDDSNNSDFCTHRVRLVRETTSNDNINLRFSNVNTTSGAVVCVPLLADDFNNVSSFQGTVRWDSDVINYKNVQEFSLPGMSESSFFNQSPGVLGFVWFDNTGQTPVTLIDGSSVYEVCFDVVGSDGESSAVTLSDDPVRIELSNGNAESLSFTNTPGTVTIGTGADCSNDTVPPTAICDQMLTANAVNGIVTVDAEEFDRGSFDNCTPTEDLQFTFDSGSDSQEFNITEADASGNIDVVIVVADQSGNTNSCISQLSLSEEFCDFDMDDIIFPTVLLRVDVTINDISEVATAFTPDALLSLPGIEEKDVFPTYSNQNCANIVSSFSDIVFTEDQSVGHYKIVRDWVVLDWVDADIFEGTQVIQNFDGFDNFICDTEPRSAPIGDCASGHTLEDDVEWPNDITGIIDHRIHPDELVMSSNIDPADARPTFFNEPDMYTLDFIDLVVDLTADELVIGRVWTASRTDIIGLEWEYQQLLTVDLTEFGNLVTVSTLGSRPVPDVDVDGFNMTNMEGFVYSTEPVIDPNKSDEATNGLNILDLLLMQAHDLGIRELDEFQIAAGDVDGDQEISNSDIVDVRKVILGIDDNLSSEWSFIDRTALTESGIDPKAHFIAVKPGDVDDSAVLSNDFVFDATETIFIRDTLINAGENYSIPLFFGRDIESLGAELHLDFDNDALMIRSVSATDAFGEISWSLTDDNSIVILNTNIDNRISSFR